MTHESSKKLGLPIGDLPLPVVNRIKSKRGTHTESRPNH